MSTNQNPVESPEPEDSVETEQVEDIYDDTTEEDYDLADVEIVEETEGVVESDG